MADLDHEYRRQLGLGVLDQFAPSTRDLRLWRCASCGLEHFQPLVAGSSGFYAALGRAQQYYSTTRWEFTETVRRLPPDPDLLDVGCGDGFFLSMVSGTRRRGIEFNPDAAQRARDKGLQVALTRLEDVPAASADQVTLFQVLEHTPDPRGFLAAAARVLRPGGRLFVAVPNNDTWVGEGPSNPLNAPPHHPLRWRAEALRYAARLVDLRLEELLAEPLAPEHLYAYRRTRFLSGLGRLFGWQPPRYRLTTTSVALRKVANLWTEVSVRLAPGCPKTPGTGHSCLAIYRKPDSPGSADGAGSAAA